MNFSYLVNGLLLRNCAEEIIRMAYRGLLRREPDAPGLAAYTQELKQISDLERLLADINGSEEGWQIMLSSHAQDLVRAVYHGILSREPDEEGLAAYREMAIHDLANMLREITGSEEFRSAFLAKVSPNLVRAVYLGVLNREPDEEGLAAYREMAVHNLANMLREITGSEEFRSTFLAKVSPNLVRAVYLGVLNREPDEEGLAAYREIAVHDLANMLREILESEEFRKQFMAVHAADLVQSIYRGLLGREADEEGLTLYTGLLNSGQDLAPILAAIITSNEFKRVRKAAQKTIPPRKAYEQPAIVFLHIQKTAGTSARNMLLQSYGVRNVYHEYFDSLDQYSPSELAPYSLFIGHFNHDSLVFIPRRKLSVFTFVRQPKARLYSLYHYWRAYEPGHPDYVGGIPLANELLIEKFFQDSRINRSHGIWNHMAWAIMGYKVWQEWQPMLLAANDPPAVQHLLEEVFRPAIRARLEEFLFVGLQEQFDLSTTLLFNILQLPPPETIRADHSLEKLLDSKPHFKKSLEKQPMTAELDAIFDTLVQIDDVVYQEATSIFQSFINKHIDTH